jgi:hypothetical protein
MMRIVVILAAIAAFGHHVSSRPQKLPFNPSSFLGGSNSNNNNSGGPFGCNPAALLNPDTISSFIPIPGGQAQATAAPAAPAEAGSARKKRNRPSFPFEELIPTGIPNSWVPAGVGIGAGDTANVANASGN